MGGLSYSSDFTFLSVHRTLSVAAANGAHVGLIDPTNGQVKKVIDTVPVPLNMRMINYVGAKSLLLRPILNYNRLSKQKTRCLC